MKIEATRIPTDFGGEVCYTHARAVILRDGFGIMTAQPLRLTGIDVFYGMYISKTYDGGKSWSALTPSKTLVRQAMGDGYEMAMCGATPILHKKAEKLSLSGRAQYILTTTARPHRAPDLRYIRSMTKKAVIFIS